MSLDKQVSITINKVINYYESNGAHLNYTPSFLIKNEPFSMQPTASARVAAEDEFIEIYGNYLRKNLSKIFWKEFFGITLSNSALAEISEISQKRILNRHHQYPLTTDIEFYKPFIESNKNIQEKIIAHEIWHLIEKENNVFRSSPLIVEGTATYAMKQYKHENIQNHQDYYEFLEILYFKSCDLVNLKLKKVINPLEKLLNEVKLREEIQNEMLDYLKPRITTSFLNTLHNPLMKKSCISEIRKSHPELTKLKGKLSKESLIKTYKTLGLKTFSSELKNQDVSQFIFKLKELEIV